MSAASTRVSVPSPQSRPRVLIADDSRVIRMAIKKILGAEYDLVEVGDGAAAWDRIREDTEIQALVTDIEMPNVDGYELICRIRGAEETRLRDLPVITITGAEDEETKLRAFACGATDFIIKPIDAIQLRARVQAYVRYDQTTRELTEKSAILEDQAIMDSTTGLCSRRYLIQRGDQDLAFAVRRGTDLSLIRVDIDHFKKLYKTHGDDISEALLTWFAKLFLGAARTEDTVARVAGAQFAILTNAVGIEAATTLCKRLQATVARQPFCHGSQTIPITLSMGMASLLQDRRENIEELLKLAQQRLNHAQSEGGDRVCSTILAEMQTIEEFVVPALEFPDDNLSSQPESATAPAVDTMSVSELEEIVRKEAEGTLDLIGMTPPVAEPNTDFSLSDLDLVTEPVSADTLASMELAGIEEPSSQASECLPDLNNEMDVVQPVTSDASTTTPPSDDTLSVDQALRLLAEGRTDLLAPFLDALIQKIKPLMEFSAHARRNDPGLPSGDNAGAETRRH